MKEGWENSGSKVFRKILQIQASKIRICMFSSLNTIFSLLNFDMQSTKVLNKLLKEAPKNTKGSKEIAELRELIIELMKPRLGKLRQILKIRMVPATRDEFQDESEDWWPDYELCSDWHAITDINVSFNT